MTEQPLDIAAAQDAMLEKRLYVIWSEVIEDLFRYMTEIEKDGAVFAAGPVVDEGSFDLRVNFSDGTYRLA